MHGQVGGHAGLRTGLNAVKTKVHVPAENRIPIVRPEASDCTDWTVATVVWFLIWRKTCCCCPCRWGETVTLNCGPQRTYCSSPGDIWVRRTTVQWYLQEKTPYWSITAPWQFYQQLSSSEAGGTWRRKCWILSTKYLFTLPVFYNMP
jgi:hypothetical protein